MSERETYHSEIHAVTEESSLLKKLTGGLSSLGGSGNRTFKGVPFNQAPSDKWVLVRSRVWSLRSEEHSKGEK